MMMMMGCCFLSAVALTGNMVWSLLFCFPYLVFFFVFL